MWNKIIKQEQAKNYFQELESFLNERREETSVYPAEKDIYKAFELTPFEDVKVVILGQDPYHQKGQAMGLAFSARSDQKIPKSLQNIFKELEDDLGIKNTHPDLSAWASQGVFLLNTIMTVEDSSPLSHQDKGWEIFTDKVLEVLGQSAEPKVFILWGQKAQAKKSFIAKHHFCLSSSHPSPLSAYRSFLGSKVFSKTNAILKKLGQKEIDWSNDL